MSVQMIGQPGGRSLPVMFDIVSDLEHEAWDVINLIILDV